MKITRRDMLKMGGGGLLSFAFPRLSFASLPTDNRFVLVVLRGALDGIAAVAPYGDSNYAATRGTLAFSPPGEIDSVLDLDGFFGLHPSLAPLLPYYKSGQLAPVHAVASPYRERSHFSAQNLLENGTLHAGGTDGWLNRALGALNAPNGMAIAINQQVPLVLQGKTNVLSWVPKGGNVNEQSDYMQVMQRLYSQDALLSRPFAEAMRAHAMAAELPADDLNSGGKAKNSGQLIIAAKAAGMFLSKEDGPRVAVLEASGWDTHQRQGTLQGALAPRLEDLGQALAALPKAMEKVWGKTVVVVVTEFGRTVHVNGTDGTDHGTGGAAFVMGGRVRGGKVLGQWPGLGENALYEGRDLMPTTDMRSIFRTVLYAHLGVSAASLDSNVFPDSASVHYMQDLLA